jgi:dCTP deaminase
VGATQHDLRNPLETGVPYLIRIAGEWALPDSAYGYANPKSSTGRVNLFCRVVADGTPTYDHLESGWEGECWVLLRADSFPILLSEGVPLVQLRIFDGKSFLSALETDVAIKKHGLIFDERRRKVVSKKLQQHADSIYLSLDVGVNFGFECRGTGKILDFSKVNAYDSADFFEPIHAPDRTFTLRKDSFYIISTLERVMVPPYLSAELRPIDVRLGEFRSHAAGYIDPGWGWGTGGEVCGRPITLEVIPHEDMLVRHGQTIARIRYECMKEEPETAYDSAASHYVSQEGPRLSKHFLPS